MSTHRIRIWAICVALLITLLIGLSAARGQSAKQEFEVVSFKHSGQIWDHQKPGTYARRLEFKGNRLTGDHDLGVYVDFAFPDTIGTRFSGAMEYYRIDAVAPIGTTIEQARAMLVKVLVDRLGLRFHIETRKTPVYYLVRGSGALHLTASSEKPVPVMQSSFQLKANAAPIKSFVGLMSSLTNREVIDRTGIEGMYRFDIDLMQELVHETDMRTVAEQLAIVEAKRLGLKLEPGSENRKYLIVDKVNKYPTPN